jgi:hypothetical protein
LLLKESSNDSFRMDGTGSKVDGGMMQR